MNTIKKSLLCLLSSLIPIAYSCECKTEQENEIEVEQRAIQKVIDEHLDAVDSLDVNKLLEGLTEDHLDMPPNMPRIVGKQAYNDFFANWVEFFKSLKDKEMTFYKDEFVVSGDWAYQIGRYSTRFIAQNDSVIEDEGNYVWIFKKDADGNWKWARTISNSIKPLPVNE